MSKDLDLRLRLTATDQNVAGTVRNTKKEVQGLGNTLSSTAAASKTSASNMAGLTTVGGEANRMFKLQKGALQQAGFQFQDLAVQIGSGTSAFVAIGQQGSQLLGILGPGGALLGAVLAVGSALGGALFSGATKAAESTETLTDRIKDLELGFKDLTSAQRAYLGLQAGQEQKAFEDRIAEEERKLSKLRETIEAFENGGFKIRTTGSAATGGILGIDNAVAGVTPDEYLDAQEAIISVNAELSTLRQEARAAGDEFDNLRFGFKEGSESAKDARKEIEEMVAALEKQADAIGKTNRERDLEIARQLKANDAQKEAINDAYNAIEQEEARLESMKRAAEAAREAEREQRNYENSVTSLIDKLDPLGAAFESTYQSQQLLIRAAQEGLITDAQRDNLIESLVEGMAEGGKDAAEAFINPFEDAAARVSQAVQNAIASGEWDTIGDAIGNTLASSISSIIDTSITRSLSRDLTANSGIGQQLAAAFAGPMLGAVAGGAVQLAINELDDYFSDDWDPTADRQASQGTGTVLGDINAKSESIRRAVEGSESGIGQLIGINQGMLYALQNLQSGISGASDRIARGRGGISIGSPGVMSGGDLFADATGGLLPIFDETLGLAFDFWDEATNILTLGLVDLGDLLGGKSKKRDEGIQIIGGYISDLIDETIVNAYATFRVKKHAFDDYDTKERFQRIGGDVERQFSAVFEGLFDTVLEAGLAIGYNEQSVLDALNQGRIGTARISLEGLSASQQQKELEAYFSSVFDDMAGGLFPFLEEFQQAGEGLGETLVRVANMVQITQEAVNRLGLQFSQLAGRDLVAASERLIEASGGIEQFINSMQGFIENFATDARQFELAQSDLTRSLERAGLELPNTRQGFFDLLQAQDAATAAGADNVALLLRLQQVADDYYTRLEDYQAEALRAQEEMIRSQRGLVVDSLRDAEDAARSVRDAIGGLSVESEAFSQARRESALASLRQMANSGVVRPGDALNSALGTASNINANQFGSFEAYIREVASTGGLLSDLDAITQEQVTVEQRMLDSLDRQLEALEQGNAEQLQALVDLQTSVDQNTAATQAVPAAAAAVASSSSSSASSASNQALLTEVRQLRSEIQGSQRSIAKHTQRTARILERLEIDGIEVRE